MSRTSTVVAPEPLELQRRAIAEKLCGAAMNPGRLGEAARAVEHSLQLLASREEEGALSPLGLLAALASGEFSTDMAAVVPVSDALRRKLPGEIARHVAISNALNSLAKTAVDTGRFEYLELVDEIRTQARLEQEILYPAAILVGDYVRMKLNELSS